MICKKRASGKRKIRLRFRNITIFFLVLWSLFASFKKCLGERYSTYNEHFEVKVSDVVFQM